MADHVKEKQIGALGFCAFSIPGILYLPQREWGWMLVILGASMLITAMGKPLSMENPSKSLRLLMIPLFLWNVVMISRIVWDISAVHRVASPLPGVLLLILGAYGVKKRVLPVVGAVLMFFLVGIYGILYLFALPEVQWDRVVWGEQWNPVGIAYGFLPLLLLYMYRGENKKGRWIWLLMGAGLTIGAAVITKGLNAPNFFTASMSVNVLGTMERLEPFVGVAVTAGGFCLMGMLFRVNENLWEIIWMQKKKYPLEIIMIIGIMGIWLIPRGETGIIDLGTTVCWGLIPILTQLVVSGKNV